MGSAMADIKNSETDAPSVGLSVARGPSLHERRVCSQCLPEYKLKTTSVIRYVKVVW